MGWIQRISLRLRALLKRRSVEREMEDELRFHLDMQIEQNRRRGMSEVEARAAAKRLFGGVERFKEECREARGVRPLEELGSDIRYGLRVLRKSPAFSATSIVILALGIGVTTAVFSVVRAYLLEPLPYAGADRLVHILRGPDRETFVAVEGLDEADWSTLSNVFDQQISWDLDLFNLTGDPRPEAVEGAWVNAGYFAALGVDPAVGRVFDAGDVRRGSRVAVISYGLWQRRFGGDPSVIGRTIKATSADRPQEPDLHTIVGVLPRDFWYFNRFTELLLPLHAERAPYMARLAPGVTMEEAEPRLNLVVGEVVRDAPPGWRMSLVSAHDEHVYRIRPTLLALIGAVAFVLLIACANVGGLLMARAVNRRREVAIRAALGARQRRIVRQLLTESTFLALVAGTLGAFLAVLLLELTGLAVQEQLRVAIPGGVDRLGLDLTVLGFTLGLSIVTGLVFGVAPALAAVRRDVRAPMHETGGRVGEGVAHTRGRDALVIGQVALSFALLVGAGLMIRTVIELQRVDLGFQPEGVIKAELVLPEDRYSDEESRVAFYDEAIAEIGRLPGVQRVGMVWPYPFRPAGGRPVTPEGVAEGPEVPLAVYHAATPDYFPTLEIGLLRGRPFGHRDRQGTPPVALVSQRLATRLWSDADPIGRRVKLGPPASEEPWRTVVGVVNDVRKTLTEEHLPDIYIPYDQNPQRSMFLMVKASPESRPSADELQTAIAAVDPDIPLHDVIEMPEIVSRAGAGYRFLSTLLVGFAAFAVLLCATGLYSTLAYAVSRRAREIAIRVALGAESTAVLALILAQGGRLVALGLAAGLLTSVLSVWALASQMFGVASADPITYAGVLAIFILTAFAAMLLPGRQALRLDPAHVLREEA